MKIRQIVSSRLGYLFVSAFTLVGVVLPSALPVAVKADGQVTSRSIQMSSAKQSDTGVTYKLTFTPATTLASGVLVLDFCGDSPIIASSSCTTPSGFTAASATAVQNNAGLTASQYSLKWSPASGGFTAGTPVTVEFQGITNPSVNPFYARMYTYTDASTATAQHTSNTAVGTYRDYGGFALETTSPVSVSATVMETMTFCVSKAAPAAGCTGTDTPSLTLGTGSPVTLDTTLRTAAAYSQVTTNAASGVSVNMKINNTCGGLLRQGTASSCDIAPAGSSAIAAGSMNGSSKVGMYIGTPVGVSPSTGTIVPTSPYNTAGSYAMNWVSGNATGVGSTYGDNIYASSAPVQNMNVPMTFGASASVTTPAGVYKADFSLIATGTF